MNYQHDKQYFGSHFCKIEKEVIWVFWTPYFEVKAQNMRDVVQSRHLPHAPPKNTSTFHGRKIWHSMLPCRPTPGRQWGKHLLIKSWAWKFMICTFPNKTKQNKRKPLNHKDVEYCCSQKDLHLQYGVCVCVCARAKLCMFSSWCLMFLLDIHSSQTKLSNSDLQREATVSLEGIGENVIFHIYIINFIINYNINNILSIPYVYT